MKHLLWIGVLGVMVSCHFLGPIDETKLKQVVIEPTSEELIGEWEVDSFTYRTIKEQYDYDGQKVTLTLKANNQFEAQQIPDFVTDGFGESVNGMFINAQGKWGLQEGEGKWNLTMKFDAGELYESGMSTTYHLFRTDSSLVIWDWIGDPDQGDRMLFEKVNQ